MIMFIIFWFLVFGFEVIIKGSVLNIVVNFVIIIGCSCCMVVCFNVFLNVSFVFFNWFVNFIIRMLFLVVRLISIIKFIWL